MLIFLIMVIEKDKLDCCNTDVSINIVYQVLVLAINFTDTEDGNLKKVQFGRIINNKLLFDSGESDSTVYKGNLYVCMYVYTCIL